MNISQLELDVENKRTMLAKALFDALVKSIEAENVSFDTSWYEIHLSNGVDLEVDFFISVSPESSELKDKGNGDLGGILSQEQLTLLKEKLDNWEKYRSRIEEAHRSEAELEVAQDLMAKLGILGSSGAHR